MSRPLFLLLGIYASILGSVLAFLPAPPHECAPRLASAKRKVGVYMSDGPQEKVKVRVKQAARNAVAASELKECGKTVYVGGKGPPERDGWVLMQTMSGVAEDGREVMAVTLPAKIRPGDLVDVEPWLVVDKPKCVNWEQAVLLPFLAANCLPQLLRCGFNEATTRGKTCVVTGGHGSAATFVVQVLKGWGAKVMSVSTNSAGALKALGADSCLDFRQQSFSEEADAVDLVVDTLGQEILEARRMLKEMKGAEYVSVMPPVLKVAVEEGVFYGAGKIMSHSKALNSETVSAYFLPTARSMEVVAAAGEMAGSGALDMGRVDRSYVGMPQYLEALAWPKDMDTGLRYGFPGKTNMVWNSWDEEEEDEEWEEEEEEGGGALSSAAKSPVVEIISTDQLRESTLSGSAVLFVTQRSCRVCKFLKPYFRKLPARHPGVSFLHLDASSSPQVARTLGLESVPVFLGYQGGARVQVLNTSKKARVDGLIEELLARQ